MIQAKKLTYKQRLFAQEYVKHKGNGTQAALQVWDQTPAAANVTAARTLTNANVQEAIEEIARKKGITQATILEEFKDLGVRKVEKVSADAKLKSLIEMAKMLRMYPSTRHTNINVSFKGKLKEMKYQDLKGYVDNMRSHNDELVQEVEELESTPPIEQAQDIA